MPLLINFAFGFETGLVTWLFCGQITRFWLFYFLFGLEKMFGLLALFWLFYQVTGIFTIFSIIYCEGMLNHKATCKNVRIGYR
jgi:hypothetical protein